MMLGRERTEKKIQCVWGGLDKRCEGRIREKRGDKMKYKSREQGKKKRE